MLNPVFSGAKDVGGADGDFIVDRCLWDIKTTIRRKADGWWFYQLLGYVLLDYDNEYGIDGVGILFPRQNESIHWPLNMLIHELSGRSDLSLDRLRQELRQKLQRNTLDARH